MPPDPPLDPQPDPPLGPVADVSQTTMLLASVRAGSTDARDELFRRFQPRLTAWLRQRLPSHARRLEDTQVMVQEVCLKAFLALDRFERRGIGSFWMFLRTTAHHHLIDVVRRRRRDENKEPMPDDSHVVPAAPGATPLEDVERHEITESFERALQTLPERTRHAVAMRLELAIDYATIADECGFSSPDAARVAIARAITLIAREMRSHDEP